MIYTLVFWMILPKTQSNPQTLRSFIIVSANSAVNFLLKIIARSCLPFGLSAVCFFPSLNQS